MINKILYSFVLLLAIGSCKQTENSFDERNVRILLNNDPETLNPFNSTSLWAGYLCKHLFQPLIDIDYESSEIVPVLAKEVPVLEKDMDGKWYLDIEIKDGARWDDGTEIDADDVIFSMKLLKLPLIDNPSLKPYFDKIEYIKADESNNKKFRIGFKSEYIQMVLCLPDLFILPSHIIDKSASLSKLSFSDIVLGKYGEDSLKIMELANNFNGDKFQRDGSVLRGSGSYTLKEWHTGQRIVLKKKENWWGEKYVSQNIFFESYPPKLYYEIIKSWTQALVSMKKQQLDVASMIPVKDFIKLKSSESMQKSFDMVVADFYAYEYLGLNMKNGFLKEKRMREAVSYLIPKDKIIKNLLHGMGEPIKSSFWSCKEVYDESVPERNYNKQRARDLLNEAGWTDSDNDGLLDQSTTEDGLQQLKLSYVYNSGNVRRENIGLLLREEFRQVGIELELVAREWSVFLDDLARHDFDIFVSAFSTSSFAPDPKQLFHTSSHYGGGSNYMGFGNAESDALINDIRGSVNPEIYVPKLKELQKTIYEEIPCVYLYSFKNRAILNKRLNSDKVYINAPGYWDGQFKP